MKQYKYKVTFENDETVEVYARTGREAIFRATVKAYDNAWPTKIKRVLSVSSGHIMEDFNVIIK